VINYTTWTDRGPERVIDLGAKVTVNVRSKK